MLFQMFTDFVAECKALKTTYGFTQKHATGVARESANTVAPKVAVAASA